MKLAEMDDGCNDSMNAASTVTDALQEEPIKISIYASDDGQYHMKYDDNTVGDGSEMPKSKRKYNANKSTAKPTTEILYEIDLYCDVCHHDYKSLMSLNRHMRTRKHLNQLSKLNEANPESVVERDWTNYDSYLSSCDSMPRNVYDSIVLDDGNGVPDASAMVPGATNTSADQHYSSNSLQNTYDPYQYVDYSSQCATTSYSSNSDIFDDIHEAMDIVATDDDDTYDENKAIVDIIQRTMCNSCKCLVCGDLFASAQLLQEHTEQMRENCAAKIDDDIDIDFETELQKLDFL